MRRFVFLAVVAGLFACKTTPQKSLGGKDGTKHVFQLGKGTFKVMDVTVAQPVEVAWAYRKDNLMTTPTYWAYRAGYWNADAPGKKAPAQWEWVKVLVPNGSGGYKDPEWTTENHFAYWAALRHPDPDDGMTFRMETEQTWTPGQPQPQPPPPPPPD